MPLPFVKLDYLYTPFDRSARVLKAGGDSVDGQQEQSLGPGSLMRRSTLRPQLAQRAQLQV